MSSHHDSLFFQLLLDLSSKSQESCGCKEDSCRDCWCGLGDGKVGATSKVAHVTILHVIGGIIVDTTLSKVIQQFLEAAHVTILHHSSYLLNDLCVLSSCFLEILQKLKYY